MAPPSRRHLQYDCPLHIIKYLEFMSKYIEDHSLAQRSITLHSTQNDTLAEAIDRDLTAGLLAAELHCKNYVCPPWSTTLHKAMTTKYILQKHLS
jgi:hypothetical protein